MGLINNIYKNGDIVINIKGQQFGGLLKMGDLIATLNVLQYMRNSNNNQSIKFYMSDSELQPNKDYVKLFKDFLLDYSNYLSPIPGDYEFEGFVELWGFRELTGEFIQIENKEELKKKICIFPLLDANYNTERTWTNELFQEIIDSFYVDDYINYEKYICTMNKLPLSIDIKDFKVNLNFIENLNHLIECEYYVGGDTGMSHFVSVLNNPSRKMSYYYNEGYHGGWRSIFTAPFYINIGKAQMNFFKK